MMAIWHCHIFQRCLKICQDYTQVVLRHCTQMTEPASAGIIIIGNEILKAQVRDTNSYFMCNLLYKCGVTVDKISVIKDDIRDIEKEIRSFSKKYTYVITSGGIGPTHDDITYEGLAKAFSDTLSYHPTLVNIIRDKFGYTDPSSASYKMAYIPSKAVLKFGKCENTGQNLPYPCITLGNVYVFPGSPIFLERSFKSLHKELFSTSNRFIKDQLYVNTTEETFAKILTNVATEFPHVTFGSYPVSNSSYYKAFVTIESNSQEETEKAKLRFSSLLPPNIFVQYDPVPQVDCIKKFEMFLQNVSQHQTYSTTLATLKDIYRNAEDVAIYFDGSVESIVLLHLAHVVRTEKKMNEELAVIYLDHRETPENEKKTHQSIISRYSINMFILKDASDQGVEKLRLLRPKIQVLLSGERKKDPNKRHLNSLINDKNLLDFQIVRPLLNWTNDDLWNLVKRLSLPFY